MRSDAYLRYETKKGANVRPVDVSLIARNAEIDGGNRCELRKVSFTIYRARRGRKNRGKKFNLIYRRTGCSVEIDSIRYIIKDVVLFLFWIDRFAIIE